MAAAGESSPSDPYCVAGVADVLSLLADGVPLERRDFRGASPSPLSDDIETSVWGAAKVRRELGESCCYDDTWFLDRIGISHMTVT